MAISFARLGRFVRSIFAPTAAIFGFSCLLTFIFVLYQPHPGPGALQHLGWQAWEAVAEVPMGTTPPTQTAGDVADVELGGAPHAPEQVDWWNVTTPETVTDAASLPLDVWDPLMAHDTGLSEIEVTTCFFDPWYMPSYTADLCAPSTTKEQDALKGKWVRVDRNLNVQGMSYLNVYYRRTRRLDLPLVTDIRILPEKEAPSPFSHTWSRVSHTVSPRGEKLYLWYNREKTLADMTNEERQTQLITEIDVTYGDDWAWYGFDRLARPVVEANPSRNLQSVWLTVRRGVKPPPRAPPLHFSHDGRFRILQVADLHFSVGPGACRDTPLSPCSDNTTLTLLDRVLAAERPDLVVFTGDQLNGQSSSWDAKSVLAKFARTVTDRGVPWAAVFGNHDDEDGESRADQVRYMRGLPYSLVQKGPKDVHGAGNYVLKVYSADASKTQLLTLYFLDSGAYSKSVFDIFGFSRGVEYDWIHQDQIDWFLQESSSISTIERPFTPDGTKDLGGVWRRQDQLTPPPKLAKPNALMFFHIPLEEAFSKPDTDPRNGEPLDVGVHGQEEHGNAKHQDGFFHKGVLRAKESARAGDKAPEVKVMANGHSHITENCRRVQGVWSCFGGGGSYSGYGKLGFDRRFRVYDISEYGETIRTWKHTEHVDALDMQVLAGRGAPPFE